MLRVEAMQFIDEQMKTRWPGWEPTSEQVSDWVLWLSAYAFDVARNAVRAHAGSQRYTKSPNPEKLRAMLVQFQPKSETKQEQPDPTVFVMYEGGGRGTLLAGYYFPIIVGQGANVMRVAESIRAKHEDRIGGTWKVYSDATYQEMNKMRSEYHAARVDAQRQGQEGR